MHRRSTGLARVAIIGSINRDEVWDEHGHHRRGWGGILYNIAALSQLASAQCTILPVAWLGSDATGPVGRWLSRLPHVDTSALLPLSRPGNLCQMRYISPDQRREKLQNIVPAIPYRALCRAVTVEVALINYISRADVTVATLERYRSEFNGLIYMDIHSHLLGRRRDATRFARRPADWRRVISCADVLQMNEIEFATLSGQRAQAGSVSVWAADVLTPLRCQCLLVTLGAAGAFCLTRAHGRWSLQHLRAGRRPGGIDPTGCGDTFSGLWLSKWLKGIDPVACTRAATHRAALPIRPDV